MRYSNINDVTRNNVLDEYLQFNIVKNVHKLFKILCFEECSISCMTRLGRYQNKSERSNENNTINPL